MTIAEKIRQQRRLANISQEEFSKLAGVSLKTVQRWENGERSPRMEEMNRIAQGLNISINDLLDSSPENKDNLPITIIPSQNKTSHSQETNTGMAIMTLQDGHKFEVPATPEGYAFLTNLFTMSLHQASPVTA